MTRQTNVRNDDPTLRMWAVDAEDFPAGRAWSDAISFCIRYAVLAPSTHNAQPWWFTVDDDSVTVGLDTSRGLAVVDPDDREGLISVGCALFHLRVALQHFGFTTTTELWPDPCDPEACARVTITHRGEPVPELEPLFEAIPRRHTSRAAFTDAPVSGTVLERLVRAAAAEDARLHLAVDYGTRRAIAELVTAADHQQMHDKRLRRELAGWLRPHLTRRPDGIRAYAADVGSVMSVAAPLVVRTFDIGTGRAARDHELATASPVLAVLATSADDRTAWLVAGQAIARVLLTATAANVAVGFLDRPIEIGDLRAQLARAVGADDVPQLLVRLGYGAPSPPQPRRSLDDVLGR